MRSAGTYRSINTYRESSRGLFFALPTIAALILAVVYDIEYDSSNNPASQRQGLHYLIYGPPTRKDAHPLVYAVTSTQSLNIQNSEESRPSARGGEKVTAWQWRSENFSNGGPIIRPTTFFQAHYFFGRTHLKLIEKQENSKEVRGMLLRKIFENLHAVMAILVFF